ncbi:MAG: hypothetical protein QMC93_01140 [Patescibacteria group bacterium]|nr:hypothetical protein [Patescibacteria group bacterium]
MTPLELILSEIPDFEKCRSGGAVHLPKFGGCGRYFPQTPFLAAAAASSF